MFNLDWFFFLFWEEMSYFGLRFKSLNVRLVVDSVTSRVRILLESSKRCAFRAILAGKLWNWRKPKRKTERRRKSKLETRNRGICANCFVMILKGGEFKRQKLSKLISENWKLKALKFSGKIQKINKFTKNWVWILKSEKRNLWIFRENLKKINKVHIFLTAMKGI